MAALGEGREYGLISKNASSGNKTVVQLKLTESSLKAIEEYLRIKGTTSRRPTIQFKGNQGVIVIPGNKSSQDPEASRTFQFSLSNVEQNARYEAIQQSENSPLLSLGVMEHKISVQATSEVYKTTRERITQVEEERVKVCTKEVKANEPTIGRKSKKQSSGASRSSHNGHMGRVKPFQGRSGSTLSSMSTTSTASHSSSLSSAPSSSNHHLSHSQPDPRAAMLSRPKAPFTSALRPSSAGSSSKSNSGIINMPFRDRIIHLLAIRPYKKPEILIKLHQDGIREKDRNTLGSVLQQVGTLNRDNSYTLARHLYADVRMDWPYYSEADRQLLKRTMSTLALDGRCVSTSPAVSPASTDKSPASTDKSPASSSPSWSPSSQAQKRPADEVYETEPTQKKRISHHRTKALEAAKAAAPERNGAHSSEYSPDSKYSPDSNCENVDETADDGDSDRPDYVRRYILITNPEQRAKYKQMFNEEYAEYRTLHSAVQEVTKRFCHLQAQIQHTPEGSADFERVKSRIVEEYHQKKRDPKFQEQKKRYDYLHSKLAHIKKLISEYDQAQLIALS